MAEIYSKAHITPAATSASESTNGFYRTRTEDRSAKHQIHTLEHPHMGNQSLEIVVWDNFPVPDKSFVTGNLPLLQRAWAYQERLLSPRTVHFAHDMLYWECSKLTTNEFSGRMTGLKLDGVVHAVKALLSSKEEQQTGAMTSIANSTSYEPSPRLRISWYNIVGKFTTCSLTYPSDVLPALQGLARRMQSLRQCTYYAGLWEDTLFSDLLWAAKDGTSRSSSRQEYRAPTWSWASITGAVVWPYSHNSIKKEVQIVSASINPIGDDLLVEVSGGELKLRGRSLSGTLKHCGPQMTLLLVNGRTGQLNFDWHQDSPSSETDQRVTVVVIGSMLKDSFYLVLTETHVKQQEYRKLGIASHEVKDMRSTMVKYLDGPMDYEACRSCERWESCRHLKNFTVI